MIQFILIAGLSLLVSLFVGMVIINVSLPNRLIDYPNVRKIHNEPTPKIGGILILSSLIITSLFFGYFANQTYNYYIIICIAFFLIGLLDDTYDWRYKKKLYSQIIFVILFILVIPVDMSTLKFSTISINVPWINYILLSLWIIGIINSFNFLDGINFLAGSLAIIFLAGYSLLFFNIQSNIIIGLYLILIFSIVGFLFFNRSPAKMFLGDSGSLFLGFLIATTPFILNEKYGAGIDITYPVIITSILLLETTYLIFNRITNSKSPFAPDKTHIHHILMQLNFRNQHIVLIISTFAIFFVILAYYSKQLLFYQIIIIELFLFFLIIVLPRYLVRSRKSITIK